MSAEQITAAVGRVLETTDDREGPEFWGAVFDEGLAWVHFPVGHGGLGLSPSWQRTAANQLREAGGSLANYRLNILGIGMGGPVLAAHGTDEQKSRWLRRMRAAAPCACSGSQ